MQRALTFERTGPQLTEKDVEVGESRLGIRLPPKYRAFLKRHNGGVPERCGMRIPNHWDGTDLLDCLWGIDYPDAVHDLLARRGDFPEYASRGLLPIGNTASGSLVCIELSHQGSEPIVYLDISDTDDPRVRRAYPLAADIDKFCADLQP